MCISDHVNFSKIVFQVVDLEYFFSVLLIILIYMIEVYWYLIRLIIFDNFSN